MKSPNIFKTLSKYGSRQEEDYLTESFVLLIKMLLERNPSIGLGFVNKICGLIENKEFKKTELLSISTQVIVDDGRPDITIKYGSTILVYLEIKHDASLGEGQLEYYRKKLDESDYQNTALILLTRSQASSQETTLSKNEYHHICWYDVHRWLSKIRIESRETICNYFIKDFLGFLEGKQMSLERIGWEYINGVPSLVAMCNLLEVAILETTPNVKSKKNGGFGWMGFNIDGTFFCGVRYSNPMTVVFENNNGNSPTYKYDFDLNKVHFFSLDQAEQLECLVNFIKEADAGIKNVKQS
jgi:hypothetical protein